MMAYLRDLGVNAIEVMPLSNVGVSVDWGYLPIGYFGVDERFGKRSDFQAARRHRPSARHRCHRRRRVRAHRRRLPYYDAYTRLQYRENPFMGPFAKDYFSNFGKSTDFQRQLTRDYFFTVNHHWLEVYHVDGFRYDCVPNYWDGPLGVGYASLVYDTYQLAKAQIAQGQPYWNRFDAGPGSPITLDSVRRAAGGPAGGPADDLFQQHLAESDVRRGQVGRTRRSRPPHRSGICARGFSATPKQENSNGDVIPKAALQYIENHDHERFLCNFG